MLWITLTLLAMSCSVNAVRLDVRFNQTLERLGLSADSHFNAAYGARINVSPRETAVCEEGNYCVKAWWFNSAAMPTTPSPILFEEAILNIDPSDFDRQNCIGLYLTCNHTCPSVQYSTPTGRLLRFDREYCEETGEKRTISAEHLLYPVSVRSSDSCASLSFINNFARTAGLEFQISLDLDQMRRYENASFLLLEGKLVMSGSNGSGLSSDETFLWTVDRRVDDFYISLYTINCAECSAGQRLAYQSKEPLTGSVAELQLFIRHVTHSASLTCFYVNGVRVSCLDGPVLGSRTISFLSLNSQNNFNFKPVTANFTEVKIYELGQPKALISESEIQALYNGSDANVGCKCQSTDYPFVKRNDWEQFGESISEYDSNCYTHTGHGAGMTERMNDKNHGVSEAFDGRISTAWMTKTGSDGVRMNFTFANRIIVKGVGLTMSVLPLSCKAYSSEGVLVSRIEMSCASGDANCVTWPSITADLANSQSQSPTLNWIFNRTTDTDALHLQFDGLQDAETEFLLINEISIIATCSCASDASCLVDSSATPTNSAINHRCECPRIVAGTHCDRCDDGFYTEEPRGIVDGPGLCSLCQCDKRGTCTMKDGECVNDNIDKCNNEGQCSCRDGNYTKYDNTNHKCQAEIIEPLEPRYGPASGTSTVTLFGKYILGYDAVVLSREGESESVRIKERHHANADGYESLVFLMPPAADGIENMTVSLRGHSEVGYNYMPDPTISKVHYRDINTKGGLEVHVEGDNLNSSAQPTMLTHLFCDTTRTRFDTVKSGCAGNRTAMTCKTPDISQVLRINKAQCVRAFRAKRSPGIVVPMPMTDFSGIYVEFGFEFDGYLKYQHRNSTLKTTIYDDPQFFNLTEYEGQREPDNTTLTLTGAYLLKCCIPSDYSVFINNETCKIISLDDSTIICLLPESWLEASIGSERNITVTIGTNVTHLLGKIVKVDYDYDSIWDDKTFVLTIAISCTVTCVITMIISGVVCCVYHRHYFYGETNIKVMIRDPYQEQYPATLDSNVHLRHNGHYPLQPTHYIQGPRIDDVDLKYVQNTDIDGSSLTGDDESIEPKRSYYIRQDSTNSYNNQGYYEVEM